MTDPNEAALPEIANSAYRDILNRPHESAMTHLLAALREAVLLERQRCAEIARAYNDNGVVFRKYREGIATAIEKGNK